LVDQEEGKAGYSSPQIGDSTSCINQRSDICEVVAAYRSEIQGIQARQDYRVIQLSEVEVDPVFSEPIPTLLPFVPIMKGGNEEPVIRLALRQLQQDPLLGELEPLLAFFARFVLKSEVAAQIMFA